MNINIQQTKKIISKSRVMTYKKGFTLVEMLISVVIFSCVVTMAVGILVTVMNANKHVRSTSMSVGFVNTVLEKMFREVSAGSHYRCDDGSAFYAYIDEDESSGNLPPGLKNHLSNEATCSDFKEAFIFEGIDGDISTPDDQIIYLFDSGNNTILYSQNGGDSYERLIDDRVVIENFEVKVVGSTIRQSGVFMGVHGYVEEGNGKRVEFAPQMMITQRIDPSILRSE